MLLLCFFISDLYHCKMCLRGQGWIKTPGQQGGTDGFPSMLLKWQFHFKPQLLNWVLTTRLQPQDSGCLTSCQQLLC